MAEELPSLCSMRSAPWRVAILVAFFVLISSTVTQSAKEIGVADIVVGNVYGRNLSKRMNAGDKLIYNQRVRTGRDSGTTLEFNDQKFGD